MPLLKPSRCRHGNIVDFCKACAEIDGWRHIAERLSSEIVLLRDVLDSYRSRTRECPCCDAPPPPNEDAETYHATDCAWMSSGTAQALFCDARALAIQAIETRGVV